ncbi:MAG: hypothetical protein ABI217_03715 [Chthoniobacterales bacterium]
MPTDPNEKSKCKEEADEREKETPPSDKKIVPPAGAPIGEGDDNLRRRADWFQKRTGGKP